MTCLIGKVEPALVEAEKTVTAVVAAAAAAAVAVAVAVILSVADALVVAGIAALAQIFADQLAANANDHRLPRLY
jgi:hypothetical protein